jgi:hypothetical protein
MKGDSILPVRFAVKVWRKTAMRSVFRGHRRHLMTSEKRLLFWILELPAWTVSGGGFEPCFTRRLFVADALFGSEAIPVIRFEQAFPTENKFQQF